MAPANAPEGIETKDTPVADRDQPTSAGFVPGAGDAREQMEAHARAQGVHPITGETDAEVAAAQSDGDKRLRGEIIPDSPHGSQAVTVGDDVNLAADAERPAK